MKLFLDLTVGDLLIANFNNSHYLVVNTDDPFLVKVFDFTNKKTIHINAVQYECYFQ